MISKQKEIFNNDKGSLLISKQKEIFNKLVGQKLEEISNLDKEVNPDDLIDRYKGFTADAKFKEFDNAFSNLIMLKIRYGKTSLADAKDDQVECKSNRSK